MKGGQTFPLAHIECTVCDYIACPLVGPFIASLSVVASDIWRTLGVTQATTINLPTTTTETADSALSIPTFL